MILGTATWNANNASWCSHVVDRVLKYLIQLMMDDLPSTGGILCTTLANNLQTGDGGRVIREGHMGYWESTERYPNRSC